MRDATVLRGHAVRANYLSAGAVDVAVETADAELLEALTAQWDRHHRPPHLPDRRAGLAPPGRGVRRRLGAAARPRILRDLRRGRLGDVLVAPAARPGDARYADLIERTLFNVVATSPSRRRALVLLREYAAPAASRPRRSVDGSGVAAGVLVAARSVVRGVVLPTERGTHLCQSRRRTWRRPTAAASSCTSMRRARSAPRSPTVGESASTSRPRIRATAWSASRR